MGEHGEYLSRATIRAGKSLGMSDASVARAIGLSEPAFEQMVQGKYRLSPATKPGEIALLLITLSQSIDRLSGQEDETRLAWMQKHNAALGGAPAQLVERVEGLVATLHYLDGVRSGHFVLGTS